MKKHHMKKGHTGKAGTYGSHLTSKGMKDPHAEAEYHKHNKAHGMDHGMMPADDSDETGEGEGLTGGNYC